MAGVMAVPLVFRATYATQGCGVFSYACGGKPALCFLGGGEEEKRKENRKYADELRHWLAECRHGPAVNFITDLFASSPVDEAFSLTDTDGSGNITLAQYLAYMGVSGDDSVKATWAAWFNK